MATLRGTHDEEVLSTELIGIMPLRRTGANPNVPNNATGGRVVDRTSVQAGFPDARAGFASTPRSLLWRHASVRRRAGSRRRAAVARDGLAAGASAAL